MRKYTASQRRSLISPLHAAALTLLLLFSITRVALAAPLRPGDKAPAFKTLSDTRGFAFAGGDLKGKNTLLFFFSIYGKSTKSLIAFMNNTYKHKAAPGGDFDIIGIAIDPSRQEVEKYVEKSKIGFRVLLDISLNVENAFKVDEVPAIFLIDENTKVAAAWEGFSPDIKKNIEAALAETAAPAGKQGNGSKLQMLDEKFKKKKIIASDALAVLFSPTSNEQLLYISANHVLWHYDLAGDKRTEMATRVDSASWSPDGKSVVFARLDDEGIWTREIATEAAKRISTEGRNPVWSKRDGLIAFVAGTAEVWVHKISTGKNWRVAANGVEVQWSPGGALLMVREKNNRVWVVSPYARAGIF